MKGKKKNETFSEDSAGVNPVEESGKVAETIEENTNAALDSELWHGRLGEEFGAFYERSRLSC